MHARKNILFVGAGGELAARVLPGLSETYDIVGVAGKRDDLREYCVDMYTGDLFSNYQALLEAACRAHTFDAIVWNPVRYFFTPLLSSTRESIHAEFDLAIALPLECLKIARMQQKFNGTFVIVSSLSAFGSRKDLGTYSLVKNAQITLAEILSKESEGTFRTKVIAPTSVRTLRTEDIVRTFVAAIEDQARDIMLYKLD